MEIVDVNAAAAQLHALIDRVIEGESIYLARDGRVLVCLEPLGAAPGWHQASALRGALEVPHEVSDPPENEVAASTETFDWEVQFTEEEEALLKDIKQAVWNRVRHLYNFPD